MRDGYRNDEGDFDEDDLDDEAGGEPEEGEDDGPADVAVERLTDVETWEMYRLVAEETRFLVCSIALRARGDERRVEYAVWRVKQDLDEPGATGTVERRAGDRDWNDQAREDALRQVIFRYEGDLSIDQTRLTLRLSSRDHEDSGPDEADFEDAGGFEVDGAALPAGRR